MAKELDSRLSVLSGTASDGGARTPTASQVPRPRRRWLTRIAVPGAAVLGMLLALGWAMRATLMPAVTVDIEPVVLRPVSATEANQQAAPGAVVAQAPGWVEPDPFVTYVSALANGVVDEVLVLEGEKVEAGQVVATMIDDDARLALDAAKADVAAREAGLADARARVEAARREWETLVAPKRVKAVAKAQLEQAEAEHARLPSEIAISEARLAEAEDEYKRLSESAARGATTEIEVLQSKHRRDARVAELRAVRLREPILVARIAQLRAELEAAGQSLELRIDEKLALDAANAAVKRAEADFKLARVREAEAQLRLDRMKVRSPVDGVVMTLLAQPGHKLLQQMDGVHSAHVVHVYDPSRLQARIDVPLADAAKVSVGQPAQVVVDVLPDRVFRGRVTRIVHEADIQKNTLEVKVAIENPSPEIKPEMLARAKFLAMAHSGTDSPGDRQSGGQRAFVPRRLVLQDATIGEYVWVAEGDTAARRAVQLGGATRGDWVQVREGLKPGDLVIASGFDRLVDGTRIRVGTGGMENKQ